MKEINNNRWIPCDKETPNDPFERVLVSVRRNEGQYRFITIGKCVGKTWYWEDGERFSSDNATVEAWRHFPDVYKGEGDEGLD